MKMNLHRSVLRFCFLIAAFLFPAFVMTFILFGRSTAMGVAALLLFLFFGAITFSEKIFRRHLNIKGYLQNNELNVGIQNTLKRVALNTGGKLPRLEVFPETGRFCLVVRSWSSRGTIFLSQGTLTGSEEAELRETLQRAVNLSREKGIIVSSALLIVIMAAFEAFPRIWQDYILNPVEVSSIGRPLLNASPFSVLRFLMFRPVIRSLLGQTGGQNAMAGIQDAQASQEALVYLCRQQ
ncbi:hypothetical protein WDW86_06775 [Bdellovibrionota bacterium FG-2]